MKAVFSKPEQQSRIEHSIQRIIEQCPDDYAQKLANDPIIILDHSNMPVTTILEEVLKRTTQNGFGGVISNFKQDGTIVTAIALNLSIIDELELTSEELDAVISHELGHIYNIYPKQKVPSYSEIVNGKATREEMETAKRINMENTELYADEFAKITNSVPGLISAHKKFMNSTYCSDKDLFEFRINKLMELDS